MAEERGGREGRGGRRRAERAEVPDVSNVERLLTEVARTALEVANLLRTSGVKETAAISKLASDAARQLSRLSRELGGGRREGEKRTELLRKVMQEESKEVKAAGWTVLAIRRLVDTVRSMSRVVNVVSRTVMLSPKLFIDAVYAAAGNVTSKMAYYASAFPIAVARMGAMVGTAIARVPVLAEVAAFLPIFLSAYMTLLEIYRTVFIPVREAINTTVRFVGALWKWVNRSELLRKILKSVISVEFWTKVIALFQRGGSWLRSLGTVLGKVGSKLVGGVGAGAVAGALTAFAGKLRAVAAAVAGSGGALAAGLAGLAVTALAASSKVAYTFTPLEKVVRRSREEAEALVAESKRLVREGNTVAAGLANLASVAARSRASALQSLEEFRGWVRDSVPVLGGFIAELSYAADTAVIAGTVLAEGLSVAGAKVAEAAGNAWRALSDFFAPVVRDVSEAVTALGTAVSNAFSGLSDVATWLRDTFSGLGSKLSDVFSGLGEAVGGAADVIKEFHGRLSDAWRVLSESFTPVVKAVSDALSGVAEILSRVYGGLTNLANLLSGLANPLKGVAEAVSGAAESARNALVGAVSELARRLGSMSVNVTVNVGGERRTVETKVGETEVIDVWGAP